MSKNKKCYETKKENVWKSISGIIKKNKQKILKMAKDCYNTLPEEEKNEKREKR